MKSIVKTMGLKGVIILLLLILMAPKVAQFNPLLEIGCLIIGAFLLVLYLEAYVIWLKEGMVDSVISEISESKAFGEKLNNLMRDDLRNFSSQCINEINAASQNCTHVMNSCSQELAFNISEAKDNLASNLVQEVKKIQEQHCSIASDLVNKIDKTNKDIADKIQASNEDVVTEISDAISNRSDITNNIVEQTREAMVNSLNKVVETQHNGHEDLANTLANSFVGVDDKLTNLKGCVEKITKGFAEISEKVIKQGESLVIELKNDIETTNSMIEEATDMVQSSLDDSISKLDKIVADRNEHINAAIEENRAAVMTNLAKLAEIQVNSNKGLVESMADAFTGVDENLALFRDCLEENLKAVASVAPNANDNKDAIISAVNKHNAYLEKFQEKIKDKIKDIIEQETIEDYPNKATVISTKRNGILIQSEMRENNKLALMAGYDNGRMLFSKSFDEAGNLTSETLYGLNGQVKERRTYRPVNGNIKVEVEKF